MQCSYLASHLFPQSRAVKMPLRILLKILRRILLKMILRILLSQSLKFLCRPIIAVSIRLFAFQSTNVHIFFQSLPPVHGGLVLKVQGQILKVRSQFLFQMFPFHKISLHYFVISLSNRFCQRWLVSIFLEKTQLGREADLGWKYWPGETSKNLMKYFIQHNLLSTQSSF